MSNRSNDNLFQLIHSLEKGEKRNFKLYVKRNSSSVDLKVVQLFDAIDKMKVYDEQLLVKRNKGIKKQQLSNLKAHLYKLILSSLRLIKDENNIDIQLHEQMDFVRILYNKGLYLQSLKVLEKMKEIARQHHQFTYLQQVLFFEKKIEGLYITRSMKSRAIDLAKEAAMVNIELDRVTQLSNLSLLLYSWYIEHGHARNAKDESELRKWFEQHFPANVRQPQGFYEKLYYYQCYCWYAFIRQDYLMYYRYTRKWVELFHAQPHMIEVETAHYIKGMHNLMGAYFELQHTRKLKESIELFEKFSQRKVVLQNDNYRTLCFVYLYMAKINLHFAEGTFSEGLRLIPYLEEKLKEYELILDRHRILVFYYKIACLYFGAGHNEKTIEYLNRIIHQKPDLRNDLQCYARLLHLIAHYELGHYNLIEYLMKSVYRFMAKMGNLSTAEKEIFTFLRHSFSLTAKDIDAALAQLLERLKSIQNAPYETRAFAYLDIISWIESKLRGVPVQQIIRQKMRHHKRK